MKLKQGFALCNKYCNCTLNILNFFIHSMDFYLFKFYVNAQFAIH